jgi:hypothetical protein
MVQPVWLGWQDGLGRSALGLRPSPFRRRPNATRLSNLQVLILPTNSAIEPVTPFGISGSTTFSIWLGWQDSNLRMLGSKPSALPLGDTPFNLWD